MRAAGRTLTVSELREALTGLRDDDPVRVATLEDDMPATGVETASGGGVVVTLDVEPRRVLHVCDECGDEE
jgi:hypothetical protein